MHPGEDTHPGRCGSVRLGQETPTRPGRDSSACSHIGLWPQPAMVTIRAPGRRSTMVRPMTGGQMVSCSPGDDQGRRGDPRQAVGPVDIDQLPGRLDEPDRSHPQHVAGAGCARGPVRAKRRARMGPVTLCSQLGSNVRNPASTSTSRSTRSGKSAASRAAMRPPMEWPTMLARRMPSSSMSATSCSGTRSRSKGAPCPEAPNAGRSTARTR